MPPDPDISLYSDYKATGKIHNLFRLGGPDELRLRPRQAAHGSS